MWYVGYVGCGICSMWYVGIVYGICRVWCVVYIGCAMWYMGCEICSVGYVRCGM